MNRSFLWALITSVTAAAVIACNNAPPGPILGSDDDDDNEGGETSGDGGEGTGNTSSMGGSTGNNPPPGGGAQAKFMNEVYPAIAADCGSCHAVDPNPRFLAATAEASYNAIINYTPALIAIPENSNLVLHGEHTGPALTPAQDTLVREWLQMEADERGLVGGEEEPPPSGPTLQEALEMFADCMTYEDWTATGMNTIANSQTQFGDCNGCHAQGEGGFLANKLNDMDMFDRTRDFPFIKKLISGTVNEEGAFAGLVPSRRIQNKGLEAEECNPDIDNCHPVYSLPPNKVEAVDNFVALTMEKYEAGGCIPQP
jgi:hypothetical protein